MYKSAIRVNKIKTVAQLRGASLHAERHDEVGKARVREGAEAGEALAWSKAEKAKDYLAAFKAHKAELGAGERKNAPIAMQVLCVVSPEWVQRAGDLHDRTNPRNIALFDQAKAWAEDWAGKGAVFGMRLDLDEKGGAVVDLMIAPVRDSRNKPVISTQKPLTELKAATGERNEYSALQTSWAAWCGTHLDTDITRGLRRELTSREHLSPETYGQVMDKAREAVQKPSESLLSALQATELSSEQTDDFRNYLLLKREVSRHKEAPHVYEPPQGDILRKGVVNDARNYDANTWKIINAFKKGAEEILDAASRFGLTWDILNRPDGHEAGSKWFPVLNDRLHLGAVLAKCWHFCAHAEVFVKNLVIEDPAHHMTEKNVWPFTTGQLVERYDRHLGLDLPKQLDAYHTEQAEAVQETRERDDGFDL